MPAKTGEKCHADGPYLFIIGIFILFHKNHSPRPQFQFFYNIYDIYPDFKQNAILFHSNSGKNCSRPPFIRENFTIGDDMMKEIEIKAHVDDPERVKNILSGIGRGEISFEKEDVYWRAPPGTFPGLPPSGIRIRKETEWRNGEAVRRVLVTCKTGRIRDGIEINEELEFGVTDGESMGELLDLLGLKPAVRKHKRGRAWIWEEDAGEPPVLAELLELEGLGWFIELEILCGEGEAAPGRCRTRLLSLLEKTGIGTDRIETRPYTVMLSAIP
jgi:adenylate cyclase class 2